MEGELGRTKAFYIVLVKQRRVQATKFVNRATIREANASFSSVLGLALLLTAYSGRPVNSASLIVTVSCTYLGIQDSQKRPCKPSQEMMNFCHLRNVHVYSVQST